MRLQILELLKPFKYNMLILFLIIFFGPILEGISLSLIPVAISIIISDSSQNTFYYEIIEHLKEVYSLEQIIFSISLIIIISFILKSLFNLITSAYSVHVINLYRNKWRSELFDTYLSKDVANSYKTGELVENLLNQTARSSKYLRFFINVISKFLSTLVLIIILLFFSIEITLIFCTAFLLMSILIFLKLKPLAVNLGKEQNKYLQQTTQILTESLNGFLQIKVFNLEKIKTKEFLKKSKQQSYNFVKTVIISNLPEFFGATIFAAATLFLMLIYLEDYQQILTLLLPFLIVGKRLHSEISSLLTNYTKLKNFRPSLDLVLSDIVFNKKNINSKLSYLKNINKINFKNLSFVYSDGTMVLQNTNLILKKGDFVHVSGISGSGKTTFLNLVAGLLKPTKGKVLVNNIDINNIKLEDYLKKISYVSQDTFLFNDTLIKNLLIANKNATTEKIISVLENSNSMNFVSKLSDKFNTILGNRGEILSGGQRQRIAISRAILKHGDILIFDEATSGLDIQSENIILKNLKNNFSSNKIILFVSHKKFRNKIFNKFLHIHKNELKEI